MNDSGHPGHQLDIGIGETEAQADWLEIARLVSSAIPADVIPEVWLGQLVVASEQAATRAREKARQEARSSIANARREAEQIRIAARREVAVHRPERPTAVPLRSSNKPLTPVAPAPPKVRGVSGGRSSPDFTLATAEPASGIPAAERRVTTVEPGPGPPMPARVLKDRRVSPGVAVLSSCLILLAGFLVFERAATGWREHSAQRSLMAAFQRDRRAIAADPTGKAPVPARPGSLFGVLTVGRLGPGPMAVVEGASLDNLRRGPARDLSSRLPGQPGPVVIAGHARTYGAPFGGLGRLRVGDPISLRLMNSEYTYRVSVRPQVSPTGSHLRLPTIDDVQRAGGDTSALDQVLILVTSGGSSGATTEVVTATLDHATGSQGTQPGSDTGSKPLVITSVPGQGAGIVVALFSALWLAGLAAGYGLLRRRLPSPVTTGAVVLAGLFAAYHLYLGLDRLLPGMY